MSRGESFGVGAGEQNDVTYHYAGLQEFNGGTTKHHVVEATHPTRGLVGTLDWTTKHVHGVHVECDFQRQGVATGLWNHAQSVANGRTIPAPKHSPQRTTAGDAWAKSIGGRLPRLDRR